MAAFGDDQIGRVLGGRYRVLAPVGTGASATVFVADDVQLQRRVAVKVLHRSLAEDPAFLKRFRAEAQAVAALGHPNVMAVYDWGQDGDEPHVTPYLVLEFLGGGSLRSMLDRGRQLSPSQALLVGLEAARGLDYAHRRGFVHRDIKPANLLFGEDRRLRIADFGLARAIAEAAWTEPDGVVLGTARYASPEQARGDKVDGKTDVYSLALTLVEAVTGQVPFAADTTVATLMNRIDKLLPVSAELGSLAPVLERAGRPHPAERYDAGELARALVQAAERLPRPAPLALVPTMASGGDETVLVGVPNGRLGRDGEEGATDLTAVGNPATSPRAPMPVMVAGAPAADPTEAGPRPAAGMAAATAARAPGPTAAGPTAPATDPTVPTVGADATTVAPTPPVRPPVVTPPPAIYDADKDRPRRKLGWFIAALGALVVALLVAAGVLFFVNRSQSHAVANLVGMPRAEALNAVSEFDWKVDIQRQRNDAQPYDYVYDQAPKDGKLADGKPFTLYVSDGPLLHALPDITNQPQDAVNATLAAAGLKLNVVGQKFDETIPPGAVLSWSVGNPPVASPVGQQVPTGTPVDVVVSGGPAPRTIPDFVNHPFDEANASLAGAQLVVQQLEPQFNDSIPAGKIISLNPPSGTQVPRGSTVQIVVSKGPDTVPVPSLVGQTLDQAKATLASVNLTVGGVAGPLDKVVAATSPPAGTPAPLGTAVSLLFG
jgi:beta-lactam-binding protein with PASTA domain/tRNA A-37 threonylcarbamoyl transferase component Bud32